MKKLSFVMAAALFLFASCNETKEANTNSSNEAMNKKNVEHHLMVLQAIETGDVSKLDSVLANDVVDLEGDPTGKDIVGKEGVKSFLGSLHNYFDGLKCELLQSATSPDGQYFYATVRMTGKAKDNSMGMPAGMNMDMTSVDLVKLKDGKCTDHWGFWSNKDVEAMKRGMQMQNGNKSMPDMKKDSL